MTSADHSCLADTHVFPMEKALVVSYMNLSIEGKANSDETEQMQGLTRVFCGHKSFPCSLVLSVLRLGCYLCMVNDRCGVMK